MHIRNRIAPSSISEKINNPTNAGCKARDDIEEMLREYGFEVLGVPLFKSRTIYFNSVFLKIEKWIQYGKCIIECLFMKKNAIVFFQWPLVNTRRYYRLLSIIRPWKKMKFITLVHDLHTLRNENGMTFQEGRFLNVSDEIIVHNQKMKELCRMNGIDAYKLHVLSFFDYLVPNNYEIPIHNYGKEIAIAGNLMRKKAGFVYSLPQEGVHFHLYGSSYEENNRENITYHGVFSPSELPGKLKGSFGLVWDGDSCETCEGLGKYLRYNNPHKVSLYLVAGMPLIIWKESALADCILKLGIGIVIENLKELDMKIQSVNEHDYNSMVSRVHICANELMQGKHFKNIIEELLKKYTKK